MTPHPQRCDTCNHFDKDAPTRYSRCNELKEQIDGEDIAFVAKIGCASHSSPSPKVPTSKELISLATTDFKNREERHKRHDQSSWVSGWITGFLTESNPDWNKERGEKVRKEERERILNLIGEWGIANETSVDYTYYDGLLYLFDLQLYLNKLRDGDEKK